jgi:hypothetical protein
MSFKREVATERADRPHSYTPETTDELSCGTCGQPYKDERSLHLSYEAEPALWAETAQQSGTAIPRETGS